MPNPEHSSLRGAVLVSIGNFLWKAGFSNSNGDDLQRGVLEVTNSISDYYEEGRPLFPEVLVVNDLRFLDPMVHKVIKVNMGGLSVKEFLNAIKLCAPLAVNGWQIFIEAKNSTITYGVLTAEIDETSPSLYSQTVGELKSVVSDYAAVYIKNIGQKVVEIASPQDKLIISLNLDEPKDYSQNEVTDIAQVLTSKCHDRLKVNIKTYLEKLIDESLKVGHGNLIGIVDDEEQNIATIRAELKVTGGIYLEFPIDFELLLEQTVDNKDSQSSVL